MRKLLILVVLLSLSACATVVPVHQPQPTMVYQDQHAKVVLFEGACVNPAIVAGVKPGYRHSLKSGYALVDGQKMALCWLVIGDKIGIVDDAGNAGTMPMNSFHPSAE